MIPLPLPLRNGPAPGAAHRSRLARIAAAAAVAAFLARSGSSAQPAAGAAAAAAGRPRLHAVSEGGGFPDPVWLSLATAVGAGMVGAAAAERLAGPARRGAAAGSAALEKLVVGSVAAVALLSLNPPGGAWWTLAGTALAAGAGAQAQLLAAAHARRALAAELGRDAADEGARRAALLAGEQVETMRRLAVEGGGLIGSGTRAAGDTWERMLDVYAERARAEVMRVARRTGEVPR
ncbi:MAG: hypothetical protein ACJ8J0_15085 [Longimicrobiaceae bacterium]